MAESLNVGASVAALADRSVQDMIQQRIARQTAEQGQSGAADSDRAVTARAIESNGQAPRVESPQRPAESTRVSVSDAALARLANDSVTRQGPSDSDPSAANPVGPSELSDSGLTASQSLQAKINDLLGDRGSSANTLEATSVQDQVKVLQDFAENNDRGSDTLADASSLVQQRAQAVQNNPSSVGSGVEVVGGNRVTPQQ